MVFFRKRVDNQRCFLSRFSDRLHSTISRQIQRLETAELIETEINLNDSRSHVIKLSSIGKTVSDKIKIARLKTIKQALSDVFRTLSENAVKR